MATKKKKMGKVGPVAEKKVIPVETDPSKLVNYVCGSNYMQKGEDIKVDECFIRSSGRCLIILPFSSNPIPSIRIGCGTCHWVAPNH